MPSFMRIFGYNVYIWSNEGKPMEPVHVHISKTPQANATKVWILSDGSISLCNNASMIKSNDLKRLLNIVGEYSEEIVQMWEQYFGQEATYYDLENQAYIEDEYER